MLPRPRHRRRRLLLPPGWVALGLLLPLSCWLLGRQPKQWRQERMLDVTLPPLRPDTASLRVMRFYTDSAEYNPWLDGAGPQGRAKLARMRPWRNFALSGDAAADAARLAGIEAAVRGIRADTERAGGVRVQLGRQASYRELVALLDMMSRLDQKRYFLDSRHRPTAFYAITNRPPALAERQTSLLCCGTHNLPYYRCQPIPASGLASLRLPGRRPQLLLTGAAAALLLAALAGTFAAVPGTRR